MQDHPKKNINFQQLSKHEKDRVKQRITSSVYAYIRRRKIQKYGLGIAAASIVLLISLGIFNGLKSEDSSIEVFAKTIKDQKYTNKVQLVLSDAQQVEIDDHHSAISYSSTGDEVQIGKEQSVSQNTSNSKSIVFNTLMVPFGKRSEIVLSDGSKVWLNSGSKLIFPAQFSKDKREVYLEGEAIFEVAHRQKHPFLIKSEHHEIEVLGTIFNISNYKDDPTITTVLESGSIQINVTDDLLFNADHTVKITPGTRASFDKKGRGIITKAVATEAYFSWRDGIFIFRNDSLKSIMKKISRYYNVEIVINDEHLANETFSGYLDVKETLEHVMQTIKDTQSSKFEYELTPDNKLIIN
jgi:transmembrane sensor